jgi:hypothetical protein
LVGSDQETPTIHQWLLVSLVLGLVHVPMIKMSISLQLFPTTKAVIYVKARA